ncbi:MAG: hypothetical protein OXC57_02635 [Rhodobacteraceae bacterium]|nr:hypothetical protein [Paracoccaceae bacterium]
MASRPGRGHAIPRLRKTVTESLGTGTSSAEDRRELMGGGEHGLGQGQLGGCLDRLVD